MIARRSSLTLALVIALLAAAFALPTSAGAAWGDLDPAFGGDGIVNPGTGLTQPYATEIQPDGKVLVIGSMVSGATSTAYVTRLLPDGSPDPGFGTGGTFILSTLGA